MKKLIFLCFSISALCIQAQPRAVFPENTTQTGTLLWKMPGKAIFKVKNAGNQPLVIERVEPDCGCTAAEWTRGAIAPGKEGYITVLYDAEMLGHFDKSVEVRTNADKEPVYLRFSGDVVREKSEPSADFPVEIGDIRLSTNNIEFDDVTRGAHLTQSILVYNGTKQSYSPSLMHLPRYLQQKAIPENIRPGHVGRIELTLNSEELPTMGLTQTSIYLSRFPGDRVRRENEIGLSATLLPEVPASADGREPVAALSETRVDLSAGTDNKKMKAEIILTNTGDTPLEVLTLQVYNPGLSVSLSRRRLTPGQHAVLKISAARSNVKDFKGSRRILLITNDPKQPKQIIEVVL